MKLAAVVIFAVCMQASAGGFSQITLSETNAPLQKVFNEIQKQSGYDFVATYEILKEAGTVTVKVKRVTLEKALEECLKGKSLTYEIIAKTIVVKAVKKNDFNGGLDQNTLEPLPPVEISGRVVNDQGEPLPNVSVLIAGTKIGTITNSEGRFSLNAPDDKNIVLEISSVGYQTQRINVSGKSTLDVVLLSDTQTIGEIVVTALDISKQEKRLGFSVAVVKGSELEEARQLNPVNALMGKVSGVQIDQSASGPFGSSRIVIRGNSTLSTNNQPIFVVDGVIVDNDLVSGGRDFGNDLANLNSENFESVSILKGSAAAALYGSRAINGVVLITTKKGAQQKGLGVEVSQTVMVYNPYKGPQFQNEYGGGTVGAFFTDARDPNYQLNQQWETKVFPIDPITGEAYIDPATNRENENWGPRFANQKVRNYDGTMTEYKAYPNNFLDAFNNGTLLTTTAAISGGSDKTTYRFSMVHDDQTGIAIREMLKRNAFNLRLTHKLSSWLSADVSAGYTSRDNTNPLNLGTAPYADTFAGDNWGWAFTWNFPRNYDTKYWNQPSKYTSELFGGAPRATNPLETNKVMSPEFWFNMNNTTATLDSRNVMGRVALNAKVTDWADVIVQANLNNNYEKYENKELGFFQNFSGGSYTLNQSKKESNLLKGIVSFHDIKVARDLEFSGFVGGETYSIISSFTQGMTNRGLMVPGNYSLSNSVNSPIITGGTDFNKRINSVYASADFGYKNQLYLATTWRGDWSSTLTYANGTGNNFYNYPSASLSWIASETFNFPGFISFVKLRTNIAALGKDTDPFVINPGYIFSGKAIGLPGEPTMATFSSRSTIMPNLKPERKVSEEVGLEMRFLNSRLGFDITLYQDNTYNQILDIPTTLESGVSAVKINAGNIQNRGIEITLNGMPIQTKNFRWNSRLVFSRNKNLIVSLAEGRNDYMLESGQQEFVSSWAVVGKSYGVIRSTIQSLKYENPNNHADPKNGMTVLAWRNDARAAFPQRSNVYQDIGDINAKFRGGFSNDFSYKNWSLNVSLDAKFGGDMAMSAIRRGTHTGVFPNTLFGRDADHGGIVWTSKFDGITYDDGLMVEGIFAEGQKVSQPDGTTADVGGMTFKEAYDAGLVEPTHIAQYFYRYASSSTGVSDFWIVKSSWIALRQVALSYNLPKALVTKLKLNGISVSLIGRDLGYLYNSLPFDLNPVSLTSNRTSTAGEQGFLPMIRSIGGSIKISL